MASAVLGWCVLQLSKQSQREVNSSYLQTLADYAVSMLIVSDLEGISQVATHKLPRLSSAMEVR